MARLVAAPLIITLCATGCNTVSDPTEKYAERASVEVTGSSPVPLLLVSSTNWRFESDPETGDQWVVPLTADTVEVELPADHTVQLAPTYRILYQVINPSEDQEANVRMRVFLDDKQVFDQSATLRNATLEYSYFYW